MYLERNANNLNTNKLKRRIKLYFKYSFSYPYSSILSSSSYFPHFTNLVVVQSHRYKSTFYILHYSSNLQFPIPSNPLKNLTNLISSSLTHVTRISSHQQETQESFSVDKTTIRITSSSIRYSTT